MTPRRQHTHDAPACHAAGPRTQQHHAGLPRGRHLAHRVLSVADTLRALRRRWLASAAAPRPAGPAAPDRAALRAADPERAILATQAAHLVLLLRRQPVLVPPSITVGLPNPIPDRLGRRFELAPQFFGGTSLPHQFDDALAELRRVRPMALRHRGRSFPPQRWGVHKTG